MHRNLNATGVKDSAGMWRTVDGVAWPHWSTVQYEGQDRDLRRAGVRARRCGDEIFIHPDDDDKARPFAR